MKQLQNRWAAAVAACLLAGGIASAAEKEGGRIVLKPGLFKPLTEPPCSYCKTQHLKGLIRKDDRVVAWLRSKHNGGGVPLRHFLSSQRVINDSYGLFFYDPDGGYVSAFKKDYGYSFHGWRNGVMIAKGKDASLWSALSGKCIAGPKKGQRLTRIPSLVTDWQYWLQLHPESVAYNLFDGKRYKITPLPKTMSNEAKETMGKVDARLKPTAAVLGVEIGEKTKAFPLDAAGARACFSDEFNGQPIAVFWYKATRTAVAFSRKVDERTLTFYADGGSPETAPIKDRETRTRWSLAGRGIDGPLRGKKLQWVNSVQCNWYAWAAENPKTLVHETSKK
jgi:hypothetical protein